MKKVEYSPYISGVDIGCFPYMCVAFILMEEQLLTTTFLKTLAKGIKHDPLFDVPCDPYMFTRFPHFFFCPHLQFHNAHILLKNSTHKVTIHKQTTLELFYCQR